jgi:uncharacterized delta-60 repeat protein
VGEFGRAVPKPGTALLPAKGLLVVAGSLRHAGRLAGLAAGLALVSVAAPAGAYGATDRPGSFGAAVAPYGSRSASAVTPARAGDGDPDPSVFGVDGKVGVHGSATSDDMLVGVSLYPDGRIIASGYREEADAELSTVTRRNPDGSPDTSFGDGDGVVSVKGLNGPAQKTVPTPDGGMVGVGYTAVLGQPDVAVFRLDAAGHNVASFGDNGIVQFPTHGVDLAQDVLVQPDGKILVVGNSAPADPVSAISVRRLLPDGALDPGFGLNGEATVHLSDSDLVKSVALLRDGRILVAGQADLDGQTAGVVIRLNPNGLPDKSFGAGGVVVLHVRQFTQANAVIVQKDGKIAVAGFAKAPGVAGDPVVWRLLSQGAPDPSFNGTGQVVVSNEGNDFADNSLVIASFQAQRVGQVTDSFLNRVTAAGVLDPSFGVAGTVRVHNPEATFEIGLVVQRDGRIVVAGRRGGFNIVDSVGTIDRFNPDGSFDTGR